MIRLSMHARLEFAPVAMLLLGSCGGSSALVTHDQAVDIADDSIDASGLPARVDELESRVQELEARLD